MQIWLRGLLGRTTAPLDPVSELERERRLAEAGRDRDEMEARVLETGNPSMTRGGFGAVIPPRDEWPSDRSARR